MTALIHEHTFMNKINPAVIFKAVLHNDLPIRNLSLYLSFSVPKRLQGLLLSLYLETQNWFLKPLL